jgi:hypothetical protein
LEKFVTGRKKLLLLDLEETVLDEFWKGVGAKAVHHAEVRTFLEAEQFDEVRIFSHAIANQKDIDTFEKLFKGWLEECLGITISMTNFYSTEVLFQLCRESGEFWEDDNECALRYGKDGGALQYVKLSPEFVDMDIVLLDDAIREPMNVEFPRRGVTLRMVDVTKLPVIGTEPVIRGACAL